MAKKKSQILNPNQIPNRDIFQRMNFLYQASTFMQSLDPVPQPTPLGGPEDLQRSKKTCKRKVMRPSDIARSMISTLHIIGRKNVVQMEPGIKRTICKGCHCILIPGQTSKVRVQGSDTHGHLVSTTCFRCGYARRIPAPPLPQGNTSTQVTSKNAPCDPQPTDGFDILRLPSDLKNPAASDEAALVCPLKLKPSDRRLAQKAKLPALALRNNVGHRIFVGNELQEPPIKASVTPVRTPFEQRVEHA